MGADENSENSNLVAFAVKYVLEKTGKDLGDREQELLKQIFEGKSLKELRDPNKNCQNNSIQQNILYGEGKLFSLLRQATGDNKVGIKNAKAVMKAILREELSYSEDTQQLLSPAEAQAELNGHAALIGSLSCPELGNGKTSSDQPNSHSSNGQNPNYLSSSEEYGTPLFSNGHLRQSSEADNPESFEVDDCSSDSVAEESPFPSASYTSQPDNDEPNPGSDSFGWHNFINFIKPGVPLLLSVGVLGSGLALSWLFNWYGVTNHLAGKLPEAQSGYDWALKFNPDSAAAHYNQGRFEEDKQDPKSADERYSKAMQDSFVAAPAYNNKAHLYITQYKKPAAALNLLQKALPLAKVKTVKSDIHKNMGWALLELDRYAEAEEDLRYAIELVSDRAPAHCLLAQVLEHRNNNKGALAEWKLCLGYASSYNPDEFLWIGMARQRVHSLKEK